MTPEGANGLRDCEHVKADSKGHERKTAECYEMGVTGFSHASAQVLKKLLFAVTSHFDDFAGITLQLVPRLFSPFPFRVLLNRSFRQLLFISFSWFGARAAGIIRNPKLAGTPSSFYLQSRVAFDVPLKHTCCTFRTTAATVVS